MKLRIRLLILGLAAIAASAEIYKWVDEEGKIHFGDKAPESAEVEELELPKGPTEAESKQAQREFQEQIQARKTAEETQALKALIGESPNRQQGLDDVFWAVLNSREFLFNH